MQRILQVIAVGAMAISVSPQVHAETKPVEVTLKGTSFSPSEIKVPAGQNVVVEFKNLNAAPAEIESKALKIEKVVPGGGTITVNVKARAAGKFLFVDEYHEDVAKGYFVAE